MSHHKCDCFIAVLLIFKNLLLDFQDDLRGEFLDFTTQLTYNTSTFLSIEFHKAIAGFGANEPTMTEILISRTNQELADMQVAYATCMAIGPTLL